MNGYLLLCTSALIFCLYDRNETDYNAVDFSLWKHIGREFLVKSNFVNWFHCIPQNGSLVEMTQGTVTISDSIDGTWVMIYAGVVH